MTGFYTLIAGPFDSVLEAGKARFVSGDLVVNTRTNRVVDSEDWLFDWEKQDIDCYAQRYRNRVMPK